MNKVRAGDAVQFVGSLPSMNEVLDLVASTT